ncbi:AAA family ATPase [Oscillatoria sp. FACHB-1407]|uniref:PAS domain-containing protein n=1 Tax=Oscillatoria sp. FACHB-1407 TaxID=2692847 RepID=UPI0016888C0E|nr:AAA family ATPase [Oscillatoria sp. FACHB-1407]MBD2465518.1 AAA family ATPase [Oscillatoria sp. FACHB-1407]
MIDLPGIAIQSKIYESPTSLVYRGIQMSDGRAIVVKLLKQDYPSPQELTRYRQEYAITHSLNLEGVVKAYSQQDYQRTLIILLEDFGGESLEQWMRQQSSFCPMSLPAFLQLAIALTDILGRIHANNIIHKDINPGNIVFNPGTGVVKIIDFGIATRFNRTNPTFKSPHRLEGTLAYLSPEQTGRMNRSLDYRTDFYSLGVTFYELLTGHLPFEATDVLELVHCHIAKQPIPPHEIGGVGFGVWGVEDALSSTANAIPEAVSDIVMKLVAKNAEDRYQSAWGIKSDLERCLHQLESTGQIQAIQLGLQDISDQFHIPQKLYGREAELATLLTVFDKVTGGDAESEQIDPTPHTPHPTPLMLVSGYSGVGKSALVQELYKPITAKRGYFISGKFDQFQRDIPYSAIAHALQQLVQQLLGEPDEQLQQWRSRLLSALGSNGQLIIDVIPGVELIIGKQPPVLDIGATEAQNRFNRVFQQFIRVFCAKENPLVIFLDDLQWIDSATLKLIELMLLDEQTKSLFLIGAYRSNEVNSTHPLALALERLRQQEAILQEIVLAPLTLEPLTQLVAETLHQEMKAVLPLAELVLRKTEGNPFFVGEFLRSLYSENLLSFHAEHLSWQWNIDQIQALNITDNVVELLLIKLKKLPEITQQFLRLAACIGAEFDLETLAIVCDQSPTIVFQSLLTAVQLGFIQPLSELDENLLVREYKFLHDRVQQAAYTLIDESQKQVVHLQIGRNLLEKTLPEELSERLFEVVDHFNHGIELVADQSERDEIARLNLIAGQKAKGAIAYRVAEKYLAVGRAWLAAYSWQTNYDLTLALYIETTEVAYLCGEFDQVETSVAIVLQEAKTVFDLVNVYEIKIQAYIAQGQPLQAIKTALQVLPQFGIKFTESPNQLDIQLELDATSRLFSDKSIEDLTHLPEMSEPNKLIAMRILSRIMIASWIAAPELMVLLVARQVSLSIEHGNAFSSPFAYANFGLILCGKSGDIETGYEFGKLALRLLSQSNTHSLTARTLLIVNTFIIHWKEHVRNTFQPLLRAYHNGLETGDLEYVAYAAHAYCFNFYAVGNELTEVAREIAKYNEAICQIKQETALTWNRIFQQMVANLMGYSDNPICLIGEFYNEDNQLAQHEVANDGTAIFDVYANKLFLCYFFSEYAQAVENAAIAERYLAQIVGTSFIPFYYLFDALARLAIYPESSVQIQAEILEKVAVNQEKMEYWAHYAPMNHLHKYHLLQAETARVLGQLLEAEEFYEQAIQGARDNEYLQEEALAYELAARFYLERGREKFAQTYMKEAHYCYERWGAIAKVNDLETRYPQFFAQPSSMPDALDLKASKTTSNTSHVAFDLAAVMRASQAISSEIELERLLNSLMQILIENAGAQTGCLLLENSGEWAIGASCELNDGENILTQVLQSVPIANRLCESIIQYVIRTHEFVILNDAAREGHFIHDPYIQQNQTQSLLCLPLLNQSKLIGVLYLENQLTTGAFTPERSQVLNLLSTQAAIAIENAKLYSKLRASESRMAQFLEAIPVGISIVDGAGRPYYFNQRATQLLGKGIDPSLIPNQLAEVYQTYLAGTEQKYPTEKMPIVRALSGDRTSVNDMDIRQNNVTIPVEVWGTPIFDEQGKVTYAIAAFQDITQQKQAEQLLADYNRTLEHQVSERTAELQESEAELRAREQELRLITDALPVAIGYIDAEQRHRFVNRTYEIWRSCSRDEILGKSIRELVDDTAYQVLEPYVNQALGGQATTFEAEILLPTGKKYLSITLIPDFDANAQVIGFYALNTDIGHHKKAEKVLRQSEAQFREQAILSAFRADVGSALAQSDRLSLMLHRCVEAVVKHFNAAFARIWTLNKDENILELQASAGMYTRLDGTYSRVPVGSFKVGRIAQDRCPLLTNNVFCESSIDQEWAEREGMVAFAGYPILLEEQLVGVIAMFARHPIPSSNFEALEFAAHEIALGIRRKQAEVALQASEAELRDVFDELRLREQELRLITDALPVCIAYIDANQQYRFVNHTYEIWCCCSRDEILGKSIREFVGNAMYLMTEPYINQALAGQTATFEAEMSLPSGNKYISTTLIPNLDGKAQVIGFYSLNVDISDRRRAEEASILEERNRMAREIHDTLAQAFTGILVHMGTVSRLVNTNPDAIQTHINTVRDLARSGLTEARRSVAALRPQALEDGNLWTALERFVATLQSSTETSLICEIIGTPYVLPAETENNLLRIAQEAFTNAIRYANATEIRIELVYESTQCFLQIRDNGQGFAANPTILNRGFGLMGMTERAERIGAQLSIESQLGQGTEVVVVIEV